MCEEDDLGHFGRVFSLFRRDQVWIVWLSRMIGFLRQRFLGGLSQERSCLCCEGQGTHREGIHSPTATYSAELLTGPRLETPHCFPWPTGERAGPQHLHSGSLSVHEGAERG